MEHPSQRTPLPYLRPNRQEQRSEITASRNPEPEYQENPAYRGGPGGSHHTQCRKAEVPEDQHPIERTIGEVGTDDRPDDRRGAPHGLQSLPEHDEEEE